MEPLLNKLGNNKVMAKSLLRHLHSALHQNSIFDATKCLPVNAMCLVEIDGQYFTIMSGNMATRQYMSVRVSPTGTQIATEKARPKRGARGKVTPWHACRCVQVSDLCVAAPLQLRRTEKSTTAVDEPNVFAVPSRKFDLWCTYWNMCGIYSNTLVDDSSQSDPNKCGYGGKIGGV